MNKDETIDYWQKREKAYIDNAIRDRQTLANKGVARLDDLTLNLEDVVGAWYSKYAEEEGITLSEAKRRIEKADIVSLQRKAEKIVGSKDFSPLANDDMKLYNLTMRINRLEYLKASIGIEISRFYSEEEAILREAFEKLALEEYERMGGILASDIKYQAKTIKNIVDGSYAAGEFGAIWSERLWGTSKVLKNILDNELTQALILGENPRKMAQRIRKATGQSKYVTERLARTEMARIQGDVQIDSYKEKDIGQYVFIAEPTACKTCKPLDGRVFSIDKKKIGTNFYPMHPNCMCSSAPYIDKEEYENSIRELLGKAPKVSSSRPIFSEMTN